MRTITRDDVLRVMREVVAEFGEDYVYQPPAGSTCVYVHLDEDGEACPSCIVAQVLHRLGVPLEAFEEGLAAHAMVDQLNNQGWGITYQAAVALSEAQRIQDAVTNIPAPVIDCTWGAAYREAADLAETTGEEAQ